MTRNLWEMEELPVFLTFFASPGYESSLRERYGVYSEYYLFTGQEREENGTTHVSWVWGDQNYTVQGQ